MASTSSVDTPLMRQYLSVKDQYPDCVLFFRLGDFYEMFFDDAVVVARALDLTLTSRDKNKDNPVPMCGVPHHASTFYLGKLVELGFKVAICDQVEDPKDAKGIVKREVVRVVTPGVVLDEEQLDPKTANYLVAVVASSEDSALVGIASLDVTTGEFCATEVVREAYIDELARLSPREVLCAGVSIAEASKKVPAFYREASPSDDKIELSGADTLGEVARRAAQTVYAYARATQPSGDLPVHRVEAYVAAEHLILDESTRANLELFSTLIGRQKQGSLYAAIDETKTSIGARMLRRWMAAPLNDLAQIRRRHDAVEWFVEHASVRADVRAQLAEVYDLERLAGRVTLGVATPRDLAGLARSLLRLPPIVEALKRELPDTLDGSRPELLDLGQDLGADLAARITQTLVDDPPAQWKDGGFCRRGFSKELDDLLDLSDGGKSKVLEIEARERERTGISSLKIRFNRVFGYYLEITRSNLDRVPKDYVRKQTLANAERFVTPELADYEAKILTADERRLGLELDVFARLRGFLAEHSARLQKLAERVARLDVLSSLAECAHNRGYVRPRMDDSLVLELTESRHPVVEQLAAAGKFVPNDLTLDSDTAQLLLITGPNMAGKSTVMRQVALSVLLAQMGSFVPATSARIGLCDRIFTRVGAADNVARGESTFMVEMRETANILRNATRRSLVVLDEIGRGTSTYDGLSIAWSVAEHLHDKVGARTLFATHYHELTALAHTRPRVRNASTAVKKWKDEIIFLHKLTEGGASRSYGIEVARLAGILPTVIARAGQLLASLEKGEDLAGPGHGSPSPSPQLALRSIVESGPSPVEKALLALDVDGTSPREALALIAELQARLRSST